MLLYQSVYLKPKLIFIATLLIFALGHIPFIRAPFVNVESWTAEAAHLIYSGQLKDALITYQSVVSNPPFAVFGIVPFYQIFGVSELSARLLFLMSGMGTIAAVYVIAKRIFSLQVGAIAALLMAINPLFWTYSTIIANNDSPFNLFSTLTLGCLMAALHLRSLKWHAIAAVFLGLALLTKYNGLVVAATVVVLVLTSGGQYLPRRLHEGLSAAKPLLVYVPGLIIVFLYSIWIISVTGRLFSASLAPLDLKMFPLFSTASLPRLAYYLIWLGMLSGPVVVFVLTDIWDSVVALRSKLGVIILTIINLG